MTRSVPVTEASLRDARYWNNASLERPGYVQWVTEGYRALAGPAIRLPDGGGMVFVRAYSRSRDGKTEQVRAHYRADPPGGKDRGEGGGSGPGTRKGGGSPPAGKASSPEDDGTALPDSWWLLPRGPIVGARPPVVPRLPGQRLPEGMRDPGGVPLPRAARRSGKEAATDTPGWAREFPRYSTETAKQYAERLMDWKYGGRQNWDSRQNRGQGSEFSRIQKNGNRGFETRSVPGSLSQEIY